MIYSIKDMSAKEKKNFQVRTPIAVRGGIRAQFMRSQSSRKWWAKRWFAFMEAMQMGARLGRGRSYAISGQVTSLEVGQGMVVATVQGGSQEAYRCEFQFDVMKASEKKEILGQLHNRPMLVAQLLIHNLPQTVARLFAAAGYPLIPTEANSFRATCSCPDPVVPCKHLAAVFFLLTEAIEQDPLLLLSLRGISREELLGVSSRARAAGPVAESLPEESIEPAVAERGKDPVFFWRGPGIGTPDFGPAPVLDGQAPLVRRLGAIPFWRGEQRFLETMEQCGVRAAVAGWHVWAGDMTPRNLDVTNQGHGLQPRAGRVRATRLDEM